METIYLKIWMTPTSDTIFELFIATVVLVFAFFILKLIIGWLT